MAERVVSVEVSVSLEFVIDDEAVSDWDGAKILEVLEARRDADPGVYTEDATMETLLGYLGITLSVENRRMGNVDGRADFPESAARGNPYGVYWHIESVNVAPPAAPADGAGGERS